MTAKRFTSMYNEQSDMIQYVDTLKEAPNKWSICNVSETLKKLNELDKENKELKNKLNLSKLKFHKMYMGQIEKNKELKEKNKFILGQIKAFRDDCVTACDFDGASTLNRLLDILGEER